MKRCSTPLIIREMLIKTTRTYHLRLVRMSIIKKKNQNQTNKKLQTLNPGEGVEKGNSPMLLVKMSITLLLYRIIWMLLKTIKLKIELPYDPVVPLLGIYLEKTIIQKDA